MSHLLYNTMSNEKKGLRFVGTVAEFREWLYCELIKYTREYKEWNDEAWLSVEGHGNNDQPATGRLPDIIRV